MEEGQLNKQRYGDKIHNISQKSGQNHHTFSRAIGDYRLKKTIVTTNECMVTKTTIFLKKVDKITIHLADQLVIIVKNYPLSSG